MLIVPIYSQQAALITCLQIPVLYGATFFIQSDTHISAHALHFLTSINKSLDFMTIFVIVDLSVRKHLY